MPHHPKEFVLWASLNDKWTRLQYMSNILSDLKSLFSKRMDIIFKVCCRQFRADWEDLDEICNFKTSRLKNCLKKRACFLFFLWVKWHFTSQSTNVWSCWDVSSAFNQYYISKIFECRTVCFFNYHLNVSLRRFFWVPTTYFFLDKR